MSLNKPSVNQKQGAQKNKTTYLANMSYSTSCTIQCRGRLSPITTLPDCQQKA